MAVSAGSYGRYLASYTVTRAPAHTVLSARDYWIYAAAAAA
jgi:hypothetical protein